MDTATSLNSRPHVEVNTGPTFVELLDQDQATSHLLNQENEKKTHPQGLTGHDGGDACTMEADSDCSDGIDSESKPPPVVFWKGLPFYTFAWEILSIALSGCFLGMLVNL